jgi:hypothetical protein
MEPPPGGPPDPTPPRLVRTNPDSFLTIPDFGGHVEFFFDEVISEGSSPSQGSGTGDIERLVILSPVKEIPEVRWRRDRITVRPREGWQRDRIYRVQLLPGVTDLRQNRSDRGTVLTFSTGAPKPATSFQGTVVDWTSARPVPEALVEATRMPDSLTYRTLADSSGRFDLGPLPPGEYVVSGVLDENRNHLADPREAFDSVRVASGRDAALELWAFVHDTTPPRIRAVSPIDSTAAAVEFTQPLDPRQRLQPSAVRLSQLPDSIPVKVASLLPRTVDDSVHGKPAADEPQEADTAAADTTEAPPRPGARPRRPAAQQLTSRPPLTDQLVLRPARPFPPGSRYVVEIRGVRNVTGVAGDAVGSLVLPERAPRDSLAGAADSLKPGTDSVRARPDTARARPDSTRARPDSARRAPR